MARHRSRRGAGGRATRVLAKFVAIQLAPDVRLRDGANRTSVLISPHGEVQLNERAAAILRLCDGSRDRDTIVAELVRSSATPTRPEDVDEFLDAATARGWIVPRSRGGQ
jgi:pyrroloquinoline quinone biosynthesis protein D